MMNTTEKGNSLLTWGLANPKATNAIIAIAGLLMLAAYAGMSTHHGTLEIFDLAIASEELVKAVAVFLKEVGLAAVVAVFINFSIEAFNRKRHDEEKHALITTINEAHASQRDAQIKAINERIFQTVYERNIPHSFFKAIEEQMLKSNFLRLDSEYSLFIDEHDDTFARVTIRHKYKIQNITSTPTPYPMSMGIDVIKSMRNEYRIKEFRAGSSALVGEELTPTVHDKSDMHEWWDVKLEHNLKADEIIDCVIELTRLSYNVSSPVKQTHQN